ncbi:hypothetical protein [Nonomuraea cavernae]|uniref:Uncharacterized protein n=1 Tax=Nonomuraea cavernae TaxID=2045107 RepID=A0A917ZAT0_9ACTN|nr:hypothetical protein [Nonomuraea cavernae]MCA2189870.1 hypothetical protein [Nonomuraea cavernae]GGO77738.1 hypothetical protein GCM10012289_58100 [Nonomuraea cavernae]
MTLFLFDPWLIAVTMMAIMLLAVWAARMLPVARRETPGFPLVYARRAAHGCANGWRRNYASCASGSRVIRDG